MIEVGPAVTVTDAPEDAVEDPVLSSVDVAVSSVCEVTVTVEPEPLVPLPSALPVGAVPLPLEVVVGSAVGVALERVLVELWPTGSSVELEESDDEPGDETVMETEPEPEPEPEPESEPVGEAVGVGPAEAVFEAEDEE